MAKPERFKHSLIVERHVSREGPSPYWIAYNGQTSMGFFTDRNAALAKLPGGDQRAALEGWLDALTRCGAKTHIDVERVKVEGFGPEAHDDGPTKMIT